MSFDRIDWHTNGDFPQDLPYNCGGTHIGFYLKWIILNDLIGSIHKVHSAYGLDQVKNDEKSGLVFLMEWCDEKIGEEDFNEIGNNFTQYYYNDEIDDGYTRYGYDLSRLFPEVETLYHIKDSLENYQKVERIINVRFRLWQRSN